MLHQKPGLLCKPVHLPPCPPTRAPRPAPARPRQVCTTDPEAAHSHKLDSFEVPYDILILGVSELWERRDFTSAGTSSPPPLPAQAPFLAGGQCSRARQCYAALPPATCVHVDTRNL